MHIWPATAFEVVPIHGRTFSRLDGHSKTWERCPASERHLRKIPTKVNKQTRNMTVRRFVVTIGTIVTWLGPHIFHLVPKHSKSWDLARDDILSILLPDIDTWLNWRLAGNYHYDGFGENHRKLASKILTPRGFSSNRDRNAFCFT